MSTSPRRDRRRGRANTTEYDSSKKSVTYGNDNEMKRLKKNGKNPPKKCLCDPLAKTHCMDSKCPIKRKSSINNKSGQNKSEWEEAEISNYSMRRGTGPQLKNLEERRSPSGGSGAGGKNRTSPSAMDSTSTDSGYARAHPKHSKHKNSGSFASINIPSDIGVATISKQKAARLHAASKAAKTPNMLNEEPSFDDASEHSYDNNSANSHKSDNRNESIKSAASDKSAQSHVFVPDINAGEAQTMWFPQYQGSHPDYVRRLEQEFDALQKNFLALTTHYARLQFRLRQVIQAQPDERSAFLSELEQMAFENMDEAYIFGKDEMPHIRHDISCMGNVRRKQNHVIQTLRNQLAELYEASNLQNFDSSINMPNERHSPVTESCTNKNSYFCALFNSKCRAAPHRKIKSRCITTNWI